jgi:DNA-binding CsgD family transcriptional regulator
MSTPDQRVHDAILDRPPVDLLQVTRDLRCLIVAQLSFDGLLVDANRGFLELGLVTSDAERAPDLRDAFLSPRFAEFCARKPDRDHSVYTGLLTLGNRDAQNYSVRGRIEVHGAHLWLVAEHDVAEHQRLAETVLALNERLVTQQRELLRARRELEAERAASQPEGSELARLAQRLTISTEVRDYGRLHADAARRLGRLTPREREILQRLAAGLTHRRIAEELGISERTVATHRDNIIRKSEAGSVAELIQLYLVG